MAKINDETTTGKTVSPTTPVQGETEDQRVLRYAKEMKNWKDDLHPYWTQMTKNEELYEFYKAEYNETSVNVALNTPFAIIEAQIAKENTASLVVSVDAEGENNLDEFEEWVAAAVKGMMEDRRVARIHGTFRKKKERFSRQLKVIGNAWGQVAYCYATQVVDGKKTVVADNPYFINGHYKHLIFNPTRQFDSSNIYYIIDHMRFEDMKNQEYVVAKGKDGSTTSSGRFRNLDKLQKSLKKDAPVLSEDTEIKYNSGDVKVAKKNEAIEVVTRWELKPAGWTRCVFANGKVMVMPDTVDPYKIGCHNLILAMRYVVEGRPYAYGEMDPIYKIARAQDTIVNQRIEIINKYLRGSYIANSSLDVDSLMLILQQGGVMSGDGTGLTSVPVITPPQGSFLETQELQQALERAARYSPYSAGAPQSADDKTQGTKGGILALQNAAEPNAKTQMDDLETMLLEPYAYVGLRMKAQYMSEDETFTALLEGKNEEWIKIAKGILAGTASLQDFVTAGIVTQEDAQSVLGTPDPRDGKPISLQTVMFETDWIVGISLSALSAQEKAQQASQEQALIEFGVKELQAQFDPDRTIEYLAEKYDADAIKSLLLTTQEKQAKMQQVQQAHQQEIQGEIAVKQAGKSQPQPQVPHVSEVIPFQYMPPASQDALLQAVGLPGGAQQQSMQQQQQALAQPATMSHE